MKVKNLLLVLVLFTSFSVAAQVGETFPDLEGESLTHQLVNIPSDLRGKCALIALAFSKKSEDELTSWFQPIYSHFIEKPDPNAIFRFEYDAHVYIIPMFTGAKRAAYKSVMKKVQKTVDPKLQQYVLFYKGTLSRYKRVLHFKGKDLPYFYVLDRKGKMVYATSGKYTRNKMQDVIDAVDDASK